MPDEVQAPAVLPILACAIGKFLLTLRESNKLLILCSHLGSPLRNLPGMAGHVTWWLVDQNIKGGGG